MAFDRVAKRVSEGGHNIPLDVIERRYYRGIKNLLNLYTPICDKGLVFDNINLISKIVAQGSTELGEVIINADIWNTILTQSYDSSD
jgi:predicted ABC-type ATPase